MKRGKIGEKKNFQRGVFSAFRRVPSALAEFGGGVRNWGFVIFRCDCFSAQRVELRAYEAPLANGRKGVFFFFFFVY